MIIVVLYDEQISFKHLFTYKHTCFVDCIIYMAYFYHTFITFLDQIVWGKKYYLKDRNCSGFQKIFLLKKTKTNYYRSETT